MRDNQKTKAELLQEVKTLRRRVAKLTKKENALRFSDPEWHSLLKNTPDIIMIVNRNGTIRFINHTIRGIKKKEVIGQKVYDFISSEHHSTMRKSLKIVFQTGRSTSHEICGVGSHGGLSWYQSELGPIKQDGHIVAASIITRDVTEHKKAEETLRESEEKWHSLAETAPGFIMTVSYDGTILFLNRPTGGLTIECTSSAKMRL